MFHVPAFIDAPSWFAIALYEIRTGRILREKADCKQSNESHTVEERRTT